VLGVVADHPATEHEAVLERRHAEEARGAAARQALSGQAERVADSRPEENAGEAVLAIDGYRLDGHASARFTFRARRAQRRSGPPRALARAPVLPGWQSLDRMLDTVSREPR